MTFDTTDNYATDLNHKGLAPPSDSIFFDRS